MTRKSNRDDIVAAKARVHELLRERRFAHVKVDVEIETEVCAAETEDSD
jgi:hypothetical protein